MSRQCSCLFWLVLTSFLFILFELCLAQSSTPAPVKPTEEEDPIKKVDDTVIYIIVAICLVFVVTVAIVIMVSSWQTRRGPPDRPSSVVRPSSFTRPPVRPNNNKGFSEIRQPNDPNGPYELSAIANVYDQQSSEPTTWWNIEQDKLIIHPTKVLGSGQFGVILLGDVIKNGQRMTCAVKTLKPDASEAERKSLKIELQNMSTMDPHPNIVNLIGAQQRNGEFFVVVEYCVNGDLYNYVKKNRIDLSARFGRKESGTSIQYFTRLRIAFDIANGMNYLSTKGFIHRDLAARNVLLDDELRAKVSDFGRTRDVGDTYKIFQSFRKNEPIPTRWMPVETLRHQIFTSQSDVWSFGVLLWEIESGATRPYNDLSTYRQVVHKVATEGYRLPQPHNCPDVIYQVMTDCWKIEADERPTFSQIAENFSNLLRAHMPAAEPQYTTLPLVK